eukprot:1557222-Prymnesium_polylepis.1
MQLDRPLPDGSAWSKGCGFIDQRNAPLRAATGKGGSKATFQPEWVYFSLLGQSPNVVGTRQLPDS